MLVPKIVKQSIEDILQLIFPPVCIVCKSTIWNKTDPPLVCPKCLKSCKPVTREFIHAQILNRLEDCFLDELYVGLQFNETMQALIHHIKYMQMNGLAAKVALFAQRFIEEEISAEKIDIAFPVPLHPLREKERGYNQSAYIARGFFKQTGIIVRTDSLERNRPTQSQTKLNREERRSNVHNAFQLPRTETILGKTVALVDDVVTTGATINECARVLKVGGAVKVVGIALATPVN